MKANVIFDPLSSFNLAKIGGSITFSQKAYHDLVFVQVHLKNLTPNKQFACHVHEYGDLSIGCQSACAHFNPYNRLHGSSQLFGFDRHVGDLAIPSGNLKSDVNGIINLHFYDDLISLFPNERCIIGRMIVIHENADDGGRYRYENTPQGKESGITGNAGKRIACAIIGMGNPSSP